MSHRQFEGKTHAELYAKYRRKHPETLISNIIAYLKEKYDGEFTTAVDVGCGSGQVTFSLAKYFKNVTGTDISAAQIEEAKYQNKCPNVKFIVSPSEDLPFKDHSVQLITAGASVHWFDIPKFFDEGERILVPGGVMAVFSYMYPELLELENDREKGRKLEKAFQMFYKEDLKGYWSERLLLPENKYRDLTIPYTDLQRFDNDEFFLERNVPLEGFLNHVRTMSGFQVYVSKNGTAKGEEVLQKFLQRVSSIMGPHNKGSVENLVIKERLTVSLVIARKSLKNGYKLNYIK